ncbi:MAG TPA: epoxide hydrolase [Methanothrix sp.]|nr:epoxide hydrolase [Methanothrix sp.]
MIQPFTIHIPQSVLDDLSDRLARTRWPDEIAGAGWDYGSNPEYLQELIEYWRTKFDWRAQERALNRFAHFRVDIEGLGIHFMHERGRGEDPMPLMLLHGWPATFQQMLKIIPSLTDPESHGGDASDSFDVIVPSLIGYGFSDRPKEKGVSVFRIGDLFARLMTEELGYRRFAVRASDLGTGVALRFGLAYPDFIFGLHLNGANPRAGAIPPQEMTEAEKKYVADVESFWAREGAYAMMHATKPQTLAYGLNDSPAGLAAWIVEKFRAWSDCDGDVEKRFTKDELLTNLTIYWATETINSSCRLYYETMQIWRGPGKKIELPTAMSIFPKDLIPQPREWTERQYNVVRWTEMPRGGHFAEMEEPQLLAEDIRAFFRQFRTQDRMDSRAA